MATARSIAREQVPETGAATPGRGDDRAPVAASSVAPRAAGRDGAMLGTFFVPIALGLAVAAFCGAALTWDGGGILFQALDMRAPVVPHQRWIHVLTQAPALLLSNVGDNTAALGVVYGLTWGLLTLASLLASWYIVRERDPALFVWPALAIGAGLLPGVFNFTAEANVALVLAWPLVLATLTGCARAHIPVTVVFALLLAICHPYAIGIFGLLAILALFAGRGADAPRRRRSRSWAMAWAVLAALALLRFAIFHTSYEDEQLSLGTLRWNFTVGVAGRPAIALACVAVVAAAVFAAPFVARRGGPALDRALRAIPLVGLLVAAFALIDWARDPHRWWLANKYTYPALLVTLAFIALATLDHARATAAERLATAGTGRDWSARLRTIQMTGLVFAVVLATQGAAWSTLTGQLRRTIDTSTWSCISMAPLGWLRGTPLDQFAAPSYALLLQGRTPARAVLHGNGCGEEAFASGIALNQFYVRPWDQGWFDLRPLRAQIVSERQTAYGCSFQLTSGWYDTETSDPYWWRWSDGRSARARIVVDGDQRVMLNGQIESSGPPDTVLLSVNGAQLTTVAIAERGSQTLGPIELPLHDGTNEVELRSSNPAREIGGRLLAFDVANLTLTGSDTGRVCRFHP